MLLAFTAIAIITIVGFLVVLDRRDKRAFEERQADRLERAGLLQRIQAPEAAVVQHQIEAYGPAEVTNPLSDRESAEREQWEQLQRQILAMEAEENGSS